jgi:predicted esterase
MAIDFEDCMRRYFEHLDRGDHEAALGVALEVRDGLPDRQHIACWWVAGAYVRGGRREEALTTLEEAAERDLTWRLGMFEAGFLQPLASDPRFAAVVQRSRERRQAYPASPHISAWEPTAGHPAAPLLLCLHGANAAAGQFEQLGRALADTGWQVVAGQSSQPTAPGLFGWDDAAVADADVDAFLGQAGAHDAARVAVVGYSQGASVALRAALRGRAPLGFAGLAAAFSPADLESTASLAGSAPRIRGIIWTGERDPYLASSRKAEQALVDAGHDVSLEPIPGRGHSLSPEMVARLPEVLSRWLG